MKRTIDLALRPASRRPGGNAIAALKDECGSDLLEFAFVAVLLMTVIFGIGSFGYGLYVYHFLGSAARDATRWAAVNGYTCNDDGSCSAPASAADITNYVLNRVPTGINPGDITAAVSWPVNSDSPPICSTTVDGEGPYQNYPGCTVEVQVSYALSFPFPLVSGPINLSDSSQMVIAH